MDIRVLCVDDDNSFLELVKRFLERNQDIKVDCIDSGEEALRILEAGNHDAVVCDYFMQDIDGLDILKAIRARGDPIPFIVFTGKGQEKVAIEALNNGADCYLQKGTDASALFAELTNMIRKTVLHTRTERDLHDTSQKLDAIIQASPVPILAIDNHDRMILWNRASERVFGWRAQEVIGSLSPLPEEMRKKFPAVREQQRKGEVQMNLEFRTARKDGSLVDIDFSSGPLRDRKGHVVGSMGIAIDLTERRRMEDKVRKVSRLYSLLSEANFAVIRAKDRAGLFKEICRIAVERGSFRMAWLGLVDEKTKKVVPVSSFGLSQDYLDGIDITLGDEETSKGPTGTAIREERLVVSEDIMTDPKMEPWRERALKLGYRSSVAIPIRSDGKVVGALNLYASEPGFFSEEDRSVLEEIASDVSYALDSLKDAESRRKVQRALKRETEMITKILDTTGAIIIVVDPEGKVVRFNKEGERVTGFMAEEIVGKPLWETLIPAEVVEGVKKVLAGLVEGNFPSEHENEWITKDGARRLIHWKNTALVDKVGSVTYVIGSGIDVTEERKNEENLRKNEAHLRLITENQIDMITQLDTRGAYAYVSASHKAVVGYDPEYLVGKMFLDFVHPDDAGEMYKEVMKAAETSSFLGSKEFRYRRADGSFIWVEASGRLIFDEKGEMLGGVFATRDITARKNAEENLKRRTQEAETAKIRAQTYLDFMSHDIMNIITPLTTYAQLISENQVNSPDTVKYAGRINSQMRRLSSFVTNVRSLSHTEVESSRGFEAVNLKEVLSKAEEEVRTNHPSRSIVVNKSLPDGPALVPGRGNVEVVIHGVLDNAVVHTKTNDVMIDIVIKRASLMSGRSNWVAEFADHGPGIPDEEKKRLLADVFEPEYATLRGVATSLAFMSLMIGHLGGTMKIEDTVKGDHSKGAKIVIRLPEVAPSDEA